MIEGVIHTENQETLSEAVFNYYNFKRNDRNLLQSALDGLTHHHFGITGTKIPLGSSQEKIIEEIQRQETEQSNLLIKLLNISPTEEASIYDVGCGRGGTMFRILEKLPLVRVDGINLTEYQTIFCSNQIINKKLENRAKVIQGTFMQTPYENETFTHAIVNEVTPYAKDLDMFFYELHRVLKPGARVSLATWCFNDEKDTTEYWRFLVPICTHYASSMHGLNSYKKSAAKYFNIESELDTSKELIDYWKLRSEWKLQSGVEPFFLKAHEEDNMRYMFFTLTKT